MSLVGGGTWASLSPRGLPTRPEKGGQARSSFSWDSPVWNGEQGGGLGTRAERVQEKSRQCQVQMVGSSRDVTRSREERRNQEAGKVLRGSAHCHKDCAGVEEEENRKGGRASPELEQEGPI